MTHGRIWIGSIYRGNQFSMLRLAGGGMGARCFGRRNLNAEAEAQSSQRLNRCLAKLKKAWDAKTKWQMPARFC